MEKKENELEYQKQQEIEQKQQESQLRLQQTQQLYEEQLKRQQEQNQRDRKVLEIVNLKSKMQAGQNNSDSLVFANGLCVNGDCSGWTQVGFLVSERRRLVLYQWHQRGPLFSYAFLDPTLHQPIVQPLVNNRQGPFFTMDKVTIPGYPGTFSVEMS